MAIPKETLASNLARSHGSTKAYVFVRNSTLCTCTSSAETKSHSTTASACVLVPEKLTSAHRGCALGKYRMHLKRIRLYLNVRKLCIAHLSACVSRALREVHPGSLSTVG